MARDGSWLRCALLVLCVAGTAAHAQDNDAAERARIKAERAAAEARYNEAKKACRAKFMVTDCIKEATRTHNAEVAVLKKQELVLNDAERKRRAAAKQQEVDERHSPERQQAEAARRARNVEEQQQRQQEAAERAAKRSAGEAERAARGPRVKTPKGAPGPQGEARAPHEPKAHALSAAEEAKNRATFEERQREAQAHKAEVQARIAQRRKKAVDLPVPPASAAK